MNIEAILFDIDGLMIDSERLSRRAWKEILNERGLHLDDSTYLTLVGRTEQDAGRILMDLYGSSFKYEEAKHDRLERFKAIIHAEGIPIKPGLPALLERIEGLGYKVGVATSTPRALATWKLHAAGLESRFGVMVTGDEVAHGKPAPDLFLEAARRLQVPPAACLVFEDSGPGIRAAHAAGMRAVMIPDLLEPDETEREMAFRVLPSLKDAIPLVEALR